LNKFLSEEKQEYEDLQQGKFKIKKIRKED
jgi:hypothetical protein